MKKVKCNNRKDKESETKILSPNSTLNTQNSPLPKGWVWVRLGEIAEIISGVSFKPNQLCKQDVKSVRILRGGNIQNDNYYLLEDDYFVPKDIVSNDQLLRRYDIILVSSTGSKQAIGKAAIIKEELNNLSVGAFLRIIRIYENIQKKYIGFYFYTLSYRNYIREIVKGVNINNIKDSYLNEMFLPLPPLPEQQRIVSKIEELFTKLDAGVEALKKAKEQIKRYRQAVLKYAFEGKLTEEWREANRDKLESASVLLERIKEERKKKLGKKYRELPPIETSELPELPKGWVCARLGEVSDITPEDDYSNFDPMLPTTFIPMSSIDEVTGTIKNPTILPLKDARKGHTHFKENDVLFARITPCMENGKSAIARNLKNGLGFGSTEFIVIRPTSCILPEIIFYFIRQETYRHRAKMHFKSTVGQLRVPKEFVILSIIPLPPLPEQQKIVEEIERRFSVADEVEKAIDNSLKQAEHLRQSILKKAFEGKLVPQDPRDEPAEKLLKRILNYEL